MKYIFQIPISLLMLWASGVSYASYSVVLSGSGDIEAYVTKTCEDGSDIGGIDVSLPQIGTSFVDAVTTARNVRKSHSNDYDSVQERLELRLEAAKMDLEGFDEASGDFSADIRYGNVYVECKSWSGNQPGMGNIPDQMINYFKTQSNLDNFQFQFDPDRWVPTSTDLNIALKANANLFDTFSKAEWDRAVTMLGGNPNIISLGNTDDLIDLISNATNFPKIVNPL